MQKVLRLKFETGFYFLKSIKNILYTWANKISQRSGSSLQFNGVRMLF